MVETLELQSVLSALWQQLAGNPANRARVIASVLVHHADSTTKKIFADLISRDTPPCPARSEALALLVPKQPVLHIQLKIESPSPAPHTLRVEPEIGRLAIALHWAAHYRLWIIARDLTRRATGSGKITRNELLAELDRLRISYTRRHFNRLLTQGNTVFWQSFEDVLYLRSLPKVAQAVVRAAEQRHLAIDTNRPGVRDVYLTVSGSLEAFEAQLYSGWIASRSIDRDITIARETQAQLFGRTEQTIRRWEDVRLQSIVTKQSNFAQCPDVERYFPYLPDHAQAYVARIEHKGKIHDVVRLYWQLPNSYHSLVKLHPCRGQAAKVRRAVNSETPASLKRGGNYRLYFTPDQLKSRFHSLKFRMGLAGDVFKPVYVFLGQHRHTHRRIFEVTNSGFIFTDASERIAAVQERAYFRRQAAKFRQSMHVEV